MYNNKYINSDIILSIYYTVKVSNWFPLLTSSFAWFAWAMYELNSRIVLLETYLFSLLFFLLQLSIDLCNKITLQGYNKKVISYQGEIKKVTQKILNSLSTNKCHQDKYIKVNEDTFLVILPMWPWTFVKTYLGCAGCKISILQ